MTARESQVVVVWYECLRYFLPIFGREGWSLCVVSVPGRWRFCDQQRYAGSIDGFGMVVLVVTVERWFAWSDFLG